MFFGISALLVVRGSLVFVIRSLFVATCYLLFVVCCVLSIVRYAVFVDSFWFALLVVC